MKILAFDTTGDINCVAILDSGKIIDVIEIENTSSGAEFLVPAIAKIMKKNNIEFVDLSAMVTSNGPSSFTSVRIGLSAAKGLVLASNKKLLTYDSLLTRAFSYLDFVGKITICIDAKMDEFFVGEFMCDGQRVTVVRESMLVKKSDLENIKIKDNQLIAGSGASYLSKIADQKNLQITIGQEKEFLADNLALMAYYDLINGASIDDKVVANYARSPKIGVRKG